MSLLWKFSKRTTASEKEIQAAKHGEYERGYSASQKNARQDVEWDTEEFEALKREKAVFEAAAGYRMTEHTAGRIGDLARCLLGRAQIGRLMTRMADVRLAAGRITGTMESFEEDLRERAAGLIETKTEVGSGEQNGH